MTWLANVLTGSMLVAPIACANSPGSPASSSLATPPASSSVASPPASSSVASPPASAPAPSPCVATEPIEATEPETTEGAPPHRALFHWYTNPDRTIWMFADVDLVPGRRSKVAWFRPAKAQLEVSGRRLDAAGPPLLVEVPLGRAYEHRFTPSSMTFPTDGCWEVVAKTEGHELRFVIKVPSNKRPGTHD